MFLFVHMVKVIQGYVILIQTNKTGGQCFWSIVIVFNTFFGFNSYLYKKKKMNKQTVEEFTDWNNDSMMVEESDLHHKSPTKPRGQIAMVALSSKRDLNKILSNLLLISSMFCPCVNANAN